MLNKNKKSNLDMISPTLTGQLLLEMLKSTSYKDLNITKIIRFRSMVEELNAFEYEDERFIKIKQDVNQEMEKINKYFSTKNIIKNKFKYILDAVEIDSEPSEPKLL